MSSAPQPGDLRRPLGVALDREIARLRLVTARGWQVLGVAGIVGALIIGASSSWALGIGCALTSLVLLAWFSLLAELLRRDRATPVIIAISTAIEGLIPWIFMVVIAYAQGPAYAIGSWVPPLLFAGVIVVSTARLQPSAPLIFGLAGGLSLPLIYFAVLRQRLPPALLEQPLYQPVMQISRGISLVGGGALAVFVARQLRAAIARADSEVRQRELFGKYRLLHRIAAGGMGTVWEAIYCPEGGFERQVAVKQIHPHLAAQPKFVEAFRNEAELSARLVHPNVVQVLDFGRIRGSYFLAMEYVDGLTLGTMLKRLRAAGIAIDPSVVVHLGRELLAGLAYSHHTARAPDGARLRVIHRDMCPANVLLSHIGEVKISDFGVARALRDAATSETKSVVGHSAYLSPEQARGAPFDERSDLFSVGVLLWEMLCGRRLFDRGADGPSLLAVVSAEVPHPSAVRADVDAGWDAFLLRALSRDPLARYPSAAAMAAALGSLNEGHTVQAVDQLVSLVVMALSLPEPRRGGVEPGGLAHEDLAPTRPLAPVPRAGRALE